MMSSLFMTDNWSQVIQEDVGMALVYKVHIQGGGDNTAPLPHNHALLHK